MKTLSRMTCASSHKGIHVNIASSLNCIIQGMCCCNSKKTKQTFTNWKKSEQKKDASNYYKAIRCRYTVISLWKLPNKAGIQSAKIFLLRKWTGLQDLAPTKLIVLSSLHRMSQIPVFFCSSELSAALYVRFQSSVLQKHKPWCWDFNQPSSGSFSLQPLCQV